MRLKALEVVPEIRPGDSLLAVLLTVLEQKKAWTSWIPSPTGMGIAMLIPFSAVTVIFVGAAVDRIWQKASPDTHERYSIPIASGLIAGESLMAVLIAALVTLHILSAE
jgi:uncharacterized oligopeptide transporter (OPT) family protein